jgi:glucose-1-phosphate cytidylyltransferase
MNHLVIDHRESMHTPPAALGRSDAQEKWRVRVIDTGVDCMTGGRVARALDAISTTDRFENFAMTYGDGLCDVDLSTEYDFHMKHGKIATILGVKTIARFGELEIVNDNQVTGFLEKPEEKQGLINGGFLFFKRDFRKYIDNDPSCILERKPLEKLADEKQMIAFKHTSFWQPMDTLRDKIQLQEMWDSGKAPWSVKQ